MGKYVIKWIRSDGYERFATIEDVRNSAILNIHFLEYDEYLVNGEASQKKQQGGIIDGVISIKLVCFSKRVGEPLSHHQKVKNYPHIEAIVEVTQIVDDYSVYAISSISDCPILVAFENVINYKIGEKILVIGSLELVNES